MTGVAENRKRYAPRSGKTLNHYEERTNQLYLKIIIIICRLVERIFYVNRINKGKGNKRCVNLLFKSVVVISHILQSSKLPTKSREFERTNS